MRRGTFVVLFFVLVAAAIVGATTLLQSQPALEITIATDPLGEAWLRDAALVFNQSGATVGVGRRVRVNIIQKSDAAVLTSPWTLADHPDGWVPAWSSVADIARASSVTAQTASGSLARTPLVWMSFQSHAADIPDLSWTGIQSSVAQSPRIDLAFSLPTQSVQGLGALISAVAEYHQTGILSEVQLFDAAMRTWLSPLIQAVPNFNTIGQNVAQFVAGPQGGTVDAAIAPESQWLTTLGTLRTKGEPRFAYPAYPVVFDFPFIVLRDSATTDEEVAAAQAFAAYLSGASAQSKLETFGLRPAQADPSPESALFTAGQAYGIAPSLPTVQTVQLPSSSGVQALQQWFGQQ